MRTIARRMFLKSSGLALLTLGIPPEFLTRALLADTAAVTRKKILICIFQRGAVDGLNMVVPFAEKAYYRVRRSIAIDPPRAGAEESALDLDGFFGLHPSLEPVLPFWRRGELAVVHACGSPHPTRSHFEAQDFMETAAPGVKTTRDGWLNRLLAENRCAECDGRTLAGGSAHAADHAVGQAGLAGDLLRGVTIAPELPLALRGTYPTLAIPDLQRFGVAGGRDRSLETTFSELYRSSSGDVVSGAADQSFDAIELLRQADPTRYSPRDGVEYPRTPFGRSLQQIAQLVKSDVGLEVAFADLGGWDTHLAQGGSRGQLANRLRELAAGLAALYSDLDDRMEDVVVITMSEFGRTVAENGSGGTDHGHGNCMLVLGGAVSGGSVLGTWPGLEAGQLHEQRDLAITTDFRDVLGEVVVRHLGATNTDRVFPGYTIDSRRFRGVLV